METPGDANDVFEREARRDRVDRRASIARSVVGRGDECPPNLEATKTRTESKPNRGAKKARPKQILASLYGRPVSSEPGLRNCNHLARFSG